MKVKTSTPFAECGMGIAKGPLLVLFLIVHFTFSAILSNGLFVQIV